MLFNKKGLNFNDITQLLQPNSHELVSRETTSEIFFAPKSAKGTCWFKLKINKRRWQLGAIRRESLDRIGSETVVVPTESAGPGPVFQITVSAEICPAMLTPRQDPTTAVGSAADGRRSALVGGGEGSNSDPPWQSGWFLFLKVDWKARNARSDSHERWIGIRASNNRDRRSYPLVHYCDLALPKRNHCTDLFNLHRCLVPIYSRTRIYIQCNTWREINRSEPFFSSGTNLKIGH